MTKVATKAASGDATAVAITTGFNIGTRHSLFISYVLGSIATTASTSVIFVLDFIINCTIAFRIIWLHKRRPELKEKLIDLIQELTIVEMVELIVPPVYLLCFSTAYFGPNASFIGNIKNSYWQYIGVEDVDYAVKIVCLFFSIDLISGIGCYFIIWCICRINLFRAHIALQKEFGDIFLVTLIFILNTVSISQTV